MEEKFIILWLGVNEWEEFTGTLEQAIADVKMDRRYKNYDRKGARIISYKTHYEISMKEVEERVIV